MNLGKTQVKGTALVTGAARRVGAVIAETLHRASYDVVIHCHQSHSDAKALAETLNQIREESACVLMANLCVQSDAVKLVHAAFDWKQRLDVLVNNASDFIKTPVTGFDEAIWDKLFTLNVKAPYWLSEQACPHLKHAENGNIINITDIHANKPLKQYMVYSQTKAALSMQTQSLAREYAPDIRVNAVAPGAVLPPEGDNALSDAVKQQLLSEIPLQTFGAAEWVADAVLHCIENRYMTGQTIRVDGGRTLGG